MCLIDGHPGKEMYLSNTSQNLGSRVTREYGKGGDRFLFYHENRGIWLIVISLTLFFLLLCFFGAGGDQEAAKGITRFLYLFGLLIIVGAILLGQKQGGALWRKRMSHPWVYGYGMVFAVMLIKGFYNWSNSPFPGFSAFVLLVSDIIIYAAPLALVPVGGQILRSRLFRWTILFHAVLGALLMSFLILTNQVYDRTDFYKTDLGIGFNHGTPTYAVVAAILMLPSASMIQTLLTYFSFGGLAVYIISFQSRIGSVMPILAFMAAVCGCIKIGRTRIAILRILLPLAVMAVIFLFASIIRGRFSEGADHLQARWTGQEGLKKSIFEDPRYIEAGFIIEGMSVADWCFGRGFHYFWSDPEFYEDLPRDMVHVGYLNYVFKGGVPLAWLMCVLPVWALRKNLKDMRPTTVIGSSWVVLQIVLLAVYGVPHMVPAWFLSCILTGAAMENWMNGGLPFSEQCRSVRKRDFDAALVNELGA